MPVAGVAAQFEVSVAWVYRLLQRRRETGSISPRKQTKFRSRSLSSDEEMRLVALITVKPDATLAELQQALPTRAALSTLWRTIDRLGLTVKKNGTRRRAATA
jgi:transposase